MRETHLSLVFTSNFFWFHHPIDLFGYVFNAINALFDQFNAVPKALFDEFIMLQIHYAAFSFD